MRAKLFLSFLGLLLAMLSGAAAAQTAAKVYRVGFLTLGGSSGPVAVAARDGLVRALAHRGYSVGAKLSVESRFAGGKQERLPALVKELVDSRVEVIVTQGYPAAEAAKEGTKMVPIVADGAGDPVESGLVASLSRPGGNVTGVSDMAAELTAKRLELLKAAVPGLHRVAMLLNYGDAGMRAQYQAATAVSLALGITIQEHGALEPKDLHWAFANMEIEKPDGIVMVTDILANAIRRRVFEFATDHRIPAMYEYASLVREGGLMSYGPARGEASRRLADLVDRILKGAKPADLPFEQPTRFRFVINLKTAKALALAIPREVLVRADEVIE